MWSCTFTAGISTTGWPWLSCLSLLTCSCPSAHVVSPAACFSITALWNISCQLSWAPYSEHERELAGDSHSRGQSLRNVDCRFTIDTWCLQEIKESDFLEAVTQAPQAVCHFYHRDFVRCQIVDRHLAEQARQHFDTRFIKVPAAVRSAGTLLPSRDLASFNELTFRHCVRELHVALTGTICNSLKFRIDHGSGQYVINWAGTSLSCEMERHRH